MITRDAARAAEAAGTWPQALQWLQRGVRRTQEGKGSARRSGRPRRALQKVLP